MVLGIPVRAETLHGRVVAIADGDTLTLLTAERREVRLRIASIDAPERSQPYGERARQALSSLAFDRAVVAEIIDVDRYGRSIAHIRADRGDIGQALVHEGAAWVFRRYSTDAALLRLEGEAREARRGLWALPERERVPPWEWRQVERLR